MPYNLFKNKELFVRHHLAMVLVLIFLIFHSSCVKHAVKYRHIVLGKNTYASRKVAKRLNELSKSIFTLKALASFKMVKGVRVRKVDVAIVIKRPNELRFDAMDSLADVWAKGGSDGNLLWLYIPSSRKFYKGSIVKRNIRKATMMDLDISEMVSVLVASPNISDAEIALQVGATREHHFSFGNIHVWIYPGRDFKIAKIVKYDSKGHMKYSAVFSDYRAVSGKFFPYNIDMEFPKNGVTVSVRYDNVSLNKSVNKSLFKPIKYMYIKHHRRKR